MKSKKVFKIAVYILFIGITFLLLLTLNSNNYSENNEEQISSLDELNGKSIGLIDSAAYEDQVKSLLPDSNIIFYNSYVDMIHDIGTERIVGYFVDKPMAISQIREVDEIMILDESIESDSYAFIMAPDKEVLMLNLNEAIRQLRDEGTLDRLATKWIFDGSATTLEIDTNYDAPNGVLHVAANTDSAPFSYEYGNRILGYDIEVLYYAAKKMGYSLKITSYSFSNLLSSVMSGKEDIGVGGISYTAERSKSLLFSDTVYTGETVAVVADSRVKMSLWESLISGFKKTVLDSQRWKSIASGLIVTIGISLLTLLFGGMLGFALSFLSRNDDGAISSVIRTLSTIINAIPLLIVLMIFYYIVFARVNISAVVIAVLAMSIYFANAIQNLLATGFKAVDKMQIQAALAMGYSRRQVFNKIEFPQAFKHMYPHLEDAVTDMIKNTSIVGYITVADLTSVSESIRNMTYQAFFPLVITAVIYFILTTIVVLIMRKVIRHYDPENRSQRIKKEYINDRA